MKIMGISGLPGSGKSMVSEVAAQKGAIIVSMGDIIREEAAKRGESSKQTAQKLREEHGPLIVAELTVKKIKNIFDENLTETIIVEGIRSPYEVNLFKKHFDNFLILSIFANPKVRFERLKNRGRADDSSDYDEFVKRDHMELDFGIGTVICLSDKIIINDGSLEDYLVEINDFFKKEMGI